MTRAFPRKWGDLPPLPAPGMTHALQVLSAGPWATPPRTHVGARCTCGTWHIHWTLDELHAALEPGQAFGDVPWACVEEGIRQQHLIHIAEVADRAARRAQDRPGRDFYG